MRSDNYSADFAAGPRSGRPEKPVVVQFSRCWSGAGDFSPPSSRPLPHSTPRIIYLFSRYYLQDSLTAHYRGRCMFFLWPTEGRLTPVLLKNALPIYSAVVYTRRENSPCRQLRGPFCRPPRDRLAEARPAPRLLITESHPLSALLGHVQLASFSMHMCTIRSLPSPSRALLSDLMSPKQL